MNNIKQILKYSDRRFKHIFGVSKRVFKIMETIISKEFKIKKINGGRKRKYSTPILLTIFLKYYRHYITMDYLTTQYDYRESSICKIISRIEQILINCEKLTVKGKNKLKNLRNTKLVIDVTESEIERPKKNQKDYYSGKKKKHTFKTQVLANAWTKFYKFTVYNINSAWSEM